MAQAEKGYQGWTNYETWAVKLWIDNEEPSYLYWRERAQECAEEYPAEGRMEENQWIQSAKHKLADELKDMHEENAPELEGVYSDLLSAALSEVNWDEIAESFLEE